MKILSNTPQPTGHGITLIAITAALALSTLQASGSPGSVYFQLPGSDITSDLEAAEWRGWISARAFGQAYRSTASTSIGRSVPKLHREFSIVRHIDSASPKLAEAFYQGRIFPQLMATYVTDNAANEDSSTTQIILENVQISSLRVSHGLLDVVNPSDDPSATPTEEISFSFEAAQFVYQPTNQSNPNPDPTPDPSDLTIDRDRDGVPDSFEKAHGMDLTTDDGDADLDGDGLTNRQEFAAGSAPNDRNSRFDIDRITLKPGKQTMGTVQFRTLPGRHYRLMASPTGQTWFELDAFDTSPDAQSAIQEIDLQLTGLTQLLRVEVTLKK